MARVERRVSTGLSGDERGFWADRAFWEYWNESIGELRQHLHAPLPPLPSKRLYAMSDAGRARLVASGSASRPWERSTGPRAEEAVWLDATEAHPFSTFAVKLQ